jgi:hypothetical protein
MTVWFGQDQITDTMLGGRDGSSCETQLQGIIALPSHPLRLETWSVWVREAIRQSGLRASGSMGYSNTRVATYTNHFSKPENQAESVLLCGEAAALASPALGACPFVQAIAVIQVSAAYPKPT